MYIYGDTQINGAISILESGEPKQFKKVRNKHYRVKTKFDTIRNRIALPLI